MRLLFYRRRRWACNVHVHAVSASAPSNFNQLLYWITIACALCVHLMSVEIMHIVLLMHSPLISVCIVATLMCLSPHSLWSNWLSINQIVAASRLNVVYVIRCASSAAATDFHLTPWIDVIVALFVFTLKGFSDIHIHRHTLRTTDILNSFNTSVVFLHHTNSVRGLNSCVSVFSVVLCLLHTTQTHKC